MNKHAIAFAASLGLTLAVGDKTTEGKQDPLAFTKDEQALLDNLLEDFDKELETQRKQVIEDQTLKVDDATLMKDILKEALVDYEQQLEMERQGFKEVMEIATTPEEKELLLNALNDYEDKLNQERQDF